MNNDLSRRTFLGAAGAVAATSVSEAPGSQEENSVRIVGVCCSPRKGKTTATALRICLHAAKAAYPNVEVELIELAGLKIDGSLAAGIPLEPGQRDDFPKVAQKIGDPKVAGIIVGTPVYFGNMSSLCKAFLDRCMVFRKDNFAFREKVGGALAVGGVRNGGQELTIQSVLTALLSQEMIVVGDGKPTAHIGGTLWNSGEAGISGDEFGISTAKNLGRRVAEVALRLRKGS